MLVYHGTTAKNAKAIERDGLQARHDKAFDILNLVTGHKLRDIEQPSVCVTKRRDVAEDFARYRVAYERTSPNHPVLYDGSLALGGPVIKLSPQVDPDAIPVLVVFNLPANWPLSEDFHSYEALENFCDSKPIPARYVREVLPVRAL